MTMRNGLEKGLKSDVPSKGWGGQNRTSKSRVPYTRPMPGKKEKPGGEVEGREATILPNYFPSSPWHRFLIRVINSRDGKKVPSLCVYPRVGEGKGSPVGLWVPEKNSSYL